MKFDSIKDIVCSLISDRYLFDNNVDFENELLSLSSKELKHKEILRIKRLSAKVDSWKTLVFVEIEADGENEIKIKLKKTLSWIASVKDSLLGAESTDLYLYLAFNDEVSIEECLRIESTELFCRKYVLLPGEEITEFVNRTFLQKLVKSIDSVDGADPLERAFSKTVAQYSWLTPEMQKTWKKAFSNLSGSDLLDALIEGGI